MDSLSGFNRYELQDCYELFIHDFHKQLVELDSNYFQNASPKLMLNLVDNKICKAFMAQPRDDAPQAIEVRKSPDSIPQGHDVLTLMVHQKLHKAIDDKGQKAVMKLFNSLQQAHNNLSNVAGVITHLREILDNEQFTFTMQRVVWPLIQLCIPGNLCSPVDVKFEKDTLKAEETFDEECSNVVLP